MIAYMIFATSNNQLVFPLV